MIVIKHVSRHSLFSFWGVIVLNVCNSLTLNLTSSNRRYTCLIDISFILIRIKTSNLFQTIINKKVMKNLKETVRKIKSRMSIEDVYMSVFEDLYWEIYIKNERNYYNFLNMVNLDKIIPVLYYNYFITYDNINDLSANLFELLNERYYFIYCNENDAYNCTDTILLNKYYTKQSLAFYALVEDKPEFKNLINDLINGFDNYILNLDFMNSILHPSSIIYSLAQEYSYTEVINHLNDYMIEEGIALPLSSFFERDLLKSNKSIVRELKPKGLFIDRLKEYEKVEEMHFWSGAIYYALIENRNMNEMYYRNKLTDTYIDNDIISEYYIAEFQYPENETPCHENVVDNDDDDFF